MNYYQLTIFLGAGAQRELLIATLSENGIEGFEEDDDMLKAFVSEVDYQEDLLARILQDAGLKYTVDVILPTNWNAQWESDFEPVIIQDFCTIRAHFHTIPVQTQYEVVITPKMSFGTGHHATTHLMVEQMSQFNFENKDVFDFGTGTGILAILAEKLGARHVVAIDNDEWSYENTKENIVLNDCHKIDVSMNSIEQIGAQFDLILANINRHILLAYMQQMYGILRAGGTLLLSGLLTDDERMVSDAAVAAGFGIVNVQQRNNWIAITCAKS